MARDPALKPYRIAVYCVYGVICALLFAIGGQEDRAKDQFLEFRPAFEKNLRVERGNITLPGEQEEVDRLTARMAWHPRLPKPLRTLVGLS